MTSRSRAALFLAGALFLSAPAGAQQATGITLSPDRPARWDAAGHVGWLGVNKSDIIDTGWNEWYDTGAFGVSAGYYWTRHLKTELDVAIATESEIFTYDSLILPGELYPYPRPRQHFFRSSTYSGSVSYQFFENSWFHPFLGAGVDVVRESSRMNVGQQVVPGRDGRPPLILPAETIGWNAEVTARPFAAGGFKVYVSERAFVRSDFRTSFSSKGAESVLWRAGVGFDF
jgi:hypothetical protein